MGHVVSNEYMERGHGDGRGENRYSREAMAGRECTPKGVTVRARDQQKNRKRKGKGRRGVKLGKKEEKWPWDRRRRMQSQINY